MEFQTLLVLHRFDGKVSRSVSNERLSQCKKLCHSLQFGGTEPPTRSNPSFDWYTEYIRRPNWWHHQISFKKCGILDTEILNFSFSFQIGLELNVPCSTWHSQRRMRLFNALFCIWFCFLVYSRRKHPWLHLVNWYPTDWISLS